MAINSHSIDDALPRNTILHGHALSVLQTLPDNSIQCCITSPPYYALRDNGTEPVIWGGNPSCTHIWDTWQEIHDVREETNHGKTRTTDRHYIDASRRFNGNHQKHSAGQFCTRCQAWRGELGLEPTPELYIQHLVAIFREVKRILRKDGVLWVNIGDGYAAKRSADRKPKDIIGVPWMLAFALRADGWWLRSDIVWEKPNAMPDSTRDRCTKSHEYVFMLSKSARYFYDADAIRESYTMKPQRRLVQRHSKRDDAMRQDKKYLYAVREEVGVGGNPLGRNKRSVWTINTCQFPEAHFSVMPLKLVEPALLASTSPQACEKCGTPWERVRTKTGHKNKREDAHAPYSAQTKTDSSGWKPTVAATTDFVPACACENNGTGSCVVLDPFAGAGTVPLAAKLAGRDYIGIELQDNYIPMIARRLLRGK